MMLGWATRKVAERMHPQTTIGLVDGELVSNTTLDAPCKPYTERLAAGATRFYEPNMGVNYTVRAAWEGAVFVATRQCDTINGGKPIVSRRWVDDETDTMVIEQDWGGAQPHRTWYSRSRGPVHRHSI